MKVQMIIARAKIFTISITNISTLNLLVSKSDGRSMTRRMAKEEPTTITSLTRTLVTMMIFDGDNDDGYPDPD